MVSNEAFKLIEVPRLNPFSNDYKTFWKQEKRRCIEGYWVGGKYMPPIVYFYINHWHIQLNKDQYAKVKSIANPFLRDNEWFKGYYHIEARGFSGFDEDDEYHANEEYKDQLDPQGRKYIPARELLPMIRKKNMGKPLYHNQAKNIIDIEARGGGKSYFGSAAIAHNFLFDGATNYDELLEEIKNGTPMASETLIGAIDTKYSKDLINKVKLGMEYLKGGIKFNGVYYPPPFAKEYSGTWDKTVIAEYEEKSGGEWMKRGSKSKIQHRSFNNNPFAANGTRPGFTALEEIGFFDNLLDSLGQLKECTADGSKKFGTIWMFGTGGDMKGGATEAAKSVFYNPEAYDCLIFNDEWENKGSIGLFVPATFSLNQYKDKEGVTNKDGALSFLMKEREKATKASDRSAIENELQNRPLKPSEAFLVLQGNVFPIADLKEHLNYIESHTKLSHFEDRGYLIRTDEGKVEWRPDHELRSADYPVLDKEDHTGCVVIWEHPELKPIPSGLYIAGIDPYDHDEAHSTKSLGSCIIYKRFVNAGQTYHWPVAEYTGRPSTANEFYENCRRLLEYYNGIALYENQVKGLKQYFQTKYCLHLLATQPSILKEITPNSKVDRGYGIHMPKEVKRYAEIKLRDWLNEEYEPGKKNLTKIYSKPLLKELIAYNVDGNFDRVIAFMLCIIQDLDMFKIVVEENTVLEIDNFFNKKLFM